MGLKLLINILLVESIECKAAQNPVKYLAVCFSTSRRRKTIRAYDRTCRVWVKLETCTVLYTDLRPNHNPKPVRVNLGTDNLFPY